LFLRLFGKNYREFEKGKGAWFILISERKKTEAKEFAKIHSIQEADAEVILLGKEKKDIVLTNDAALYYCCITESVQAWWISTLLFASLKKKIISKNQAESILFELVTTGNMRLSTDIFVEVLMIMRNLK